MNNDYRQLFNTLADLTPPLDLFSDIVARIALEQQRLLQKRLIEWSIMTALSLTALMVAGIYAVIAISQSEFISYASFLFSDTQAVLASSQTFLLSLAESIPLLPVVFLLSATLSVLISLMLVAKTRMDKTRAFHTSHFI